MMVANLRGKTLQVDDTSLIFKNQRMYPALPEQTGSVWYVDGNLGNAASNGKSWSTALLTMADAFNRMATGDTIFFKGNIREQISTPAGIFAGKIIGVGRPRHADAHTTNNGYHAPTWKVPSVEVTTTPLLTIRQQGWELYNILFDGPSAAAAVQLFRDAGADDAEDDASHAVIQGCKFVTGQNHVEVKGGLSQCEIYDNMFFGATAASFIETVGAGVGTNNYHRVMRNHFHNNISHIDCGMNYASIADNIFGKFTTVGVDLRTGSENVVVRNALYGTYSNVGGYYAGTNDEWGGNYNSTSGGVTASDPA
jgi:hypothetical protein